MYYLGLKIRDRYRVRVNRDVVEFYILCWGVGVYFVRGVLEDFRGVLKVFVLFLWI